MQTNKTQNLRSHLATLLFIIYCINWIWETALIVNLFHEKRTQKDVDFVFLLVLTSSISGITLIGKDLHNYSIFSQVYNVIFLSFYLGQLTPTLIKNFKTLFFIVIFHPTCLLCAIVYYIISIDIQSVKPKLEERLVFYDFLSYIYAYTYCKDLNFFCL